MSFVPKERFIALFSDDGRVVWASTFLFGILAILKGLGRPLLWSATQAQVDYRFGFIKRGMFGAVFTRMFHLERYVRFAVFSYCVLGLALALCVILCGRSGIVSRLGRGVAAAVFCSSFAVTFLCHLVGYFDVLQLAITAALLLVRRPVVRALFAVPLCIFAVLIHEAYLLTLFPVVIFSFVTDLVDGRISLARARTLIAFVTLAMTFLCAVAAGGKASRKLDVSALQHSIQQQTDFPLQAEFFDVFRRSVVDNMRLTLAMQASGQEAGAELSSLVILGPVLAFLLFYFRAVCKRSGTHLLEHWGIWMGVAVVCGPLSMQFLGWDIGRWYALACIDLFLALTLLLRALPSVNLPLTPVAFRAAMVVIALNMASGDTMMNNELPNPYPFVRPLQRTVRAYMQERTIRPI